MTDTLKFVFFNPVAYDPIHCRRWEAHLGGEVDVGFAVKLFWEGVEVGFVVLPLMSRFGMDGRRLGFGEI